MYSSIDNEMFRKLFDAAPDPIVIINNEGLIILINKEGENKFGYPAKEILNLPVETLVPARFRHTHSGHREGYTNKPKTRPMGSETELFALRKDGSEFPVEISLSPMTVDGKQSVVSIIRDITERKNAQETIRSKALELEVANKELQRSNKELEEFARIASHDLQEPLRSVAGACQLLRRRYADKLDAEAEEFIDFAVDGAKRMEELIKDLLTYSRVSTKATEPVPSDLQLVTTKVLANLRTSLIENRATITHDPMPRVSVDQWQITQLLQNLLSNSLKFHGEKDPIIHIGAALEGSMWHFYVRDNGIGIDPKYFDRIFEVFKRLHTRDEYPGTGIGLASCKKIVERHGGRLWAESVPGEGATFHFTLPSKINGVKN